MLADTTFVGIDPSLRHVGIAILKPKEVVEFREIKTEDKNIWEATWQIRKEMRQIITGDIGFLYPVKVGMERQIPSHGMLFHTQMVILGEFLKYLPSEEPKWICMPLPGQLKSYMAKRFGISGTKRVTVEAVQKMAPWKGRLSSHCAEAYLIARMTDEVVRREWKLNLPKKETHLIYPEMVYGGENVSDSSNSGAIGEEV